MTMQRQSDEIVPPTSGITTNPYVYFMTANPMACVKMKGIVTRYEY